VESIFSYLSAHALCLTEHQKTLQFESKGSIWIAVERQVSACTVFDPLAIHMVRGYRNAWHQAELAEAATE
jgi:hypothetical protein